MDRYPTFIALPEAGRTIRVNPQAVSFIREADRDRSVVCVDGICLSIEVSADRAVAALTGNGPRGEPPPPPPPPQR